MSIASEFYIAIKIINFDEFYKLMSNLFPEINWDDKINVRLKNINTWREALQHAWDYLQNTEFEVDGWKIFYTRFDYGEPYFKWLARKMVEIMNKKGVNKLTMPGIEIKYIV